MAEQPAPRVEDPFAASTGRLARLARRLGCTEGQLCSMAIGLLFVWVVSANALPHVDWRRSADDSATGLSVPEAAAPNAGLLDPEPAGSSTFPPLVSATPLPPWATPAGASAAPTTTPSSVPSATDPRTTVVPSTAPRVTGGGYASSAAGTPLATIGVPDGSVAVARRAGRADKVAYLRLDGGDGPLELLVDPSGVNTLAILAQLELCVVTTSGWNIGHGDVALSDAPPYDCADAVTGVPDDTGHSWVFDLTGHDLDNATGVAIVPADDAMAPEFQVVFHLLGSGHQEGTP